MKPASQIMQTAPISIVGSSTFGRYPKISIEKTFNMIISDDWLVDAAGYKKILQLIATGEGRGIYFSANLNSLVIVINNGIYLVGVSFGYTFLGNIGTFSGPVFIDENNGGQIAICDKSSIYIYNYRTSSFAKAALNFIPGYVCFQDGYFIAPDLSSNQWRLSSLNDGTTWPVINTGLLTTKPDKCVAVVRLPGKGGLIFVMGSRVTEIWYDVGAQLFPYQRSNVNIDYGCINSDSIAFNDRMVVWIGVNENSGPVLMFSNGGDPQTISTDGIDFQLADLTNPTNCYGFLFKQDGHLIYQFTFPDDRLTLAYDFNTKKFFHFSDQYMDVHIAKKVAYFNNDYYFISYSNGNLYQLSTQFTTFDGGEIPRVRTTDTFRFPDTRRYIVNSLTFICEQGEAQDIMAIDLSLSKNGGISFGNAYRKNLNPPSVRRNRMIYWGLGQANELTCQLRFWGLGRFVIGGGEISYYQ